jgi:deoxycytidylate deaminase
MANTTYFGWETPDDTDLVKDGAAAIRTLGQAIDTSLQDLEGGTTGQVLSKTSNTDMDFTWVTTDDANAIQNAIVDAKGDIIAASANDTPARLAVGTDNQRLVAASGEATGLKYVADTQNTVIDAEGDLLVGDAADAVQRLAIGSNGNVLTVDTTVDGKIKWAAPAGGGGKVLQVVQATTSTETVITSTSMQDTGITCTITPTLATSKVLVLINGQVYAYKVSNGATGDFQIVRGATAVLVCDGTTGNFAFGTKVGANTVESAHIISTAYLDSPATTSATTYKLQAACNQASDLLWQNGGLHTSTIVLMEIGA